MLESNEDVDKSPSTCMGWIVEADSKILAGYIQISVRMMAKQGWHGQFTGRLNRICMYTYILSIYIMLILEGILAEGIECIGLLKAIKVEAIVLSLG